jgi:hypothetical protein
MPLCSQRLHDRICNRFAASFAFRAVSVGMAIDAPRIAVFLHERRSGVERITTLCTEEVSSMPLGSTCDNDLALDGCFATLASG